MTFDYRCMLYALMLVTADTHAEEDCRTAVMTRSSRSPLRFPTAQSPQARV